MKGNSTDSSGDGTVLYLTMSLPDTLLVILYYSYTRCYHCRTIGKRYMICLFYFLQLHINLQLSQNFKKAEIKKSMCYTCIIFLLVQNVV